MARPRKDAPKSKRKSAEKDVVVSRPCNFPGCPEPGDFKAPMSPTELKKYRWFCLPHVREYNARWDYFTDMSGAEIEKFMQDALFGHRPTWKINAHIKNPQEHLAEAVHDMMHGSDSGWRERKARAQTRTMTPEKERKALAVLDLEGEVSLQEIKKQYKLLVKKYHPDVNRDNAKAEDRFKHITEAYQELMQLRDPSKNKN